MWNKLWKRTSHCCQSTAPWKKSCEKELCMHIQHQVEIGGVSNQLKLCSIEYQRPKMLYSLSRHLLPIVSCQFIQVFSKVYRQYCKRAKMIVLCKYQSMHLESADINTNNNFEREFSLYERNMHFFSRFIINYREV